LDEESLKHASLPQEIGFGSAQLQEFQVGL
jgi:hypothetical protein